MKSPQKKILGTSIIAHVRLTDMSVQTNDEHQLGVAKLASEFADEFGMGEYGRLMGLLHDKGKEQTDWQKYLQGVTGYNKEYVHITSGPHHAYVGACIAKKQYPQVAPLIAAPIAGHHRGLYDDCDCQEELKKSIPQDVSLPECIDIAKPNLSGCKPYDYHHLVRMLFSCLVDADSLDTEAFMTPLQASMRGSGATMEELSGIMESHLQKLRKTSANTEVNHIRNYVQDQCVKESDGKPGFYSLTVPTGGGKTLASVLWALRHAVKNNLRRIIIAIPYTSIIVQTAATLKDIFGEENVLEHHSNFLPEDIKDKQLQERLQLATENWDYPIIVTTNVQFFESLFSNKRSDCRKLHNIAGSVVIFDEVQTLPLGFYKPIVHTLDTLQRLFGVSVLFTTASQPVLTGRIEGTNPMEGFDALKSVQEIIPAESRLHERLKRVELHFIEGGKTYNEIAEELSRHQRVLCIVNTRRDAKELYERLPNEGVRLHLSRMMCPLHVAKTIQRVKMALKDPANKPIRVVATQLIEAGVDIDFPVVYRQEAGLDSILQAAGRCNREGSHTLCNTYVFSLGKEHPLPPGLIAQANNARLNMGQNEDWFAPEAMTDYFRQLHSRVSDFDIKQMNKLLYKPECEFEEAAHLFRLIDDQTTSVVVNYERSLDLYQELLSEGPSYTLMKQLSQYCVNIRKCDFELLKNAGAIEEPFEGVFAVNSAKFYSEETGLTTENQWIEETYII